MTKLSKDLFAVIPGEVYPKLFEAGTECPKELVELAKSIGVLEMKSAPENKAIKSAPENKAMKGAPESKGAK